ncbi:MAG: rRNA (cytidine1402-2-O)-methyltransferase [Actinomycetota bacterium]|nr:rRNA (cytidine1402-2-O)-methyltransferase [Actinomycetota bacterium]
MTESCPGALVLAATPIGDASDAPARLTELIATADVIAAEDTRRLRRLACALGVTPTGKIISYHEHNETVRSTELVQAALDGATVLVVTDAGMPVVSDPGLRAVRAAVDAGVRVRVVPGPSAVLTALALSGLATDRFCFEGFLPRRPGERRRALQALSDESRTMVLFEAPHRLAAALTDMAKVFGPDRPAALCREMTKTYEEVVREPLGTLAERVSDGGVRGEVTLVVAGRPADGPLSPEAIGDLVPQVLSRVEDGERLKDAVAAVAVPSRVPKRALYEAVTRARSAEDRPEVSREGTALP